MNVRQHVFVCAVVVASSTCVAGGVSAAPTSAGTPMPKPTGPVPPPPPSLYGASKPNPIHWYKFNGDVKDAVAPGIDLKAYTGDAGPSWEAGKDGTKPGAIRGYGFVEGKNAFVYPSYTVEFTMWPQAFNGKANGECTSADVFANAYGTPSGALGPFAGFNESTEISVTGCGDTSADHGKVDVRSSLTDASGKSFTAVTATAPLRSDMWHTVTVVFDGAAHKVTIAIDGSIATSAPAAGAFFVGDPGKNRVFIGLSSHRGWIPGLVDEVKIYGSAVYPGGATNMHSAVR